MTKEEMIKYHSSEKCQMEGALVGWERYPVAQGDEESRERQVNALRTRIDFHNAAIRWLEKSM